jgi:hypothetical protein
MYVCVLEIYNDLSLKFMKSSHILYYLSYLCKDVDVLEEAIEQLDHESRVRAAKDHSDAISLKWASMVHHLLTRQNLREKYL